MTNEEGLAIVDAINNMTYELEEMIPDLRMDAHDGFAETIERAVKLLNNIKSIMRDK